MGSVNVDKESLIKQLYAAGVSPDEVAEQFNKFMEEERAAAVAKEEEKKRAAAHRTIVRDNFLYCLYDYIEELFPEVELSEDAEDKIRQIFINAEDDLENNRKNKKCFDVAVDPKDLKAIYDFMRWLR